MLLTVHRKEFESMKPIRKQFTDTAIRVHQLKNQHPSFPQVLMGTKLIKMEEMENISQDSPEFNNSNRCMLLK